MCFASTPRDNHSLIQPLGSCSLYIQLKLEFALVAQLLYLRGPTTKFCHEAGLSRSPHREREREREKKKSSCFQSITLNFISYANEKPVPLGNYRRIILYNALLDILFTFYFHSHCFLSQKTGVIYVQTISKTSFQTSRNNIQMSS